MNTVININNSNTIILSQYNNNIINRIRSCSTSYTVTNTDTALNRIVEVINNYSSTIQYYSITTTKNNILV